MKFSEIAIKSLFVTWRLNRCLSFTQLRQQGSLVTIFYAHTSSFQRNVSDPGPSQRDGTLRQLGGSLVRPLQLQSVRLKCCLSPTSPEPPTSLDRHVEDVSLIFDLCEFHYFFNDATMQGFFNRRELLAFGLYTRFESCRCKFLLWGQRCLWER